MWLEIFVLIAVATLTSRARIDGLQNDLDTGYSYSQPELGPSSTIQESVAYYVNIPANQEDQSYHISNQYIPSQYNRPQDFGGNSINHGLREHSHQYSQDISHFNPYQQQDSTRHNVYHMSSTRSQNHQYGLPSISHHFQQVTYQIDPRSRPHNPLPSPMINFHPRIQQSIMEIVPRSLVNQPPTPSHDLQPPPYTPHVTLQIEPKTFEGSAPKQYRIVPSVASLPMSYNARLPFPIGAVPIKFRPLPLKTHLRQAGLLPITSYQARESYKK